MNCVSHLTDVTRNAFSGARQRHKPVLSPKALHNIFTAIVPSVITYALPSFAGQLSKGDKSRINALFRKAVKRGLSHTSLKIDELIDTADKRLFRHISSKSAKPWNPI